MHTRARTSKWSDEGDYPRRDPGEGEHRPQQLLVYRVVGLLQITKHMWSGTFVVRPNSWSRRTSNSMHTMDRLGRNPHTCSSGNVVGFAVCTQTVGDSLSEDLAYTYVHKSNGDAPEVSAVGPFPLMSRPKNRKISHHSSLYGLTIIKRVITFNGGLLFS